jgi:hypothetical protein
LELPHHHHQVWATIVAEGITTPTAITTQITKARARDTVETSTNRKATIAILEEEEEEEDVGMTSIPMVTEGAVGAEVVETVEAEAAELEGIDT